MKLGEAHNLILHEKNLTIKNGQSDNTWYFFHNHIYGAAEIAKVIADLAQMNTKRAYFCALLHDIGKIREQKEQRFHGVIGYEMLKDKDEHIACACLVHSFPFNQLEDFTHIQKALFNKINDYQMLSDFINKHPLDDYDLLVQLADGLANAYGLVSIEERVEEYAHRHGIEIPFSMLYALNELKKYFDKKIGCDIYTLFSRIKNKHVFISVLDDVQKAAG